MKLNSLVRMNKDFFRVLSTEGNELLVINCNGRGSPVFLSYTLLKGLPTASECEMQEYYDVDFKEKLTASKERECNELFPFGSC
ncbi:hypothetical protein [Fibrobacter sp. UWH1]|uniref:hypothetical protein n=1 Tax=Fibrobacter sp. UWH1 TaxID=1964354 RepID=UPI000B528C86|nr:hypothetical protein [Fibrobacter sp. UWH1]OWV15566.1 hypothetical protein B7992_04060 [Fibrobacter sp. UWH1]